MRKIKLVIEYDGTAYAGWQIQSVAPTVQGVLNEALRKLTGEAELKVRGASRTDAGVHALGQVADFQTSSTIPGKSFAMAVKRHLPDDIAVISSEEVDADFGARHNSVGKEYRYLIVNRGPRSALERERAWHVPVRLDIEAMQSAANMLVGEKDFTSFCAAESDAEHFVREITSVDVERRGEIVEITVKGTAFLRHMVRIMVGLLERVGTGKVSPSEVEAIVEARERDPALMTAPPQGLYLVKVLYK